MEQHCSQLTWQNSTAMQGKVGCLFVLSPLQHAVIGKASATSPLQHAVIGKASATSPAQHAATMKPIVPGRSAV